MKLSKNVSMRRCLRFESSGFAGSDYVSIGKNEVLVAGRGLNGPRQEHFAVHLYVPVVTFEGVH